MGKRTPLRPMHEEKRPKHATVEKAGILEEPATLVRRP